MKFKAILPILGLMLFAANASAQNVIVDGDFESGSDSSWTLWLETAGMLTATFNYTADGPTSGTAGALRYQMVGEYTNGGVYQEVTLTGGNIYQVDGLIKEVSADPSTTWFEVWISDTAPVDGSDNGGVMLAKVSSWNCAGYDGDFINGCDTPAGDAKFTVPGSGPQTYYLILDAGVCCGGGAAEYVIDDVTLTDLGAPAVTYDTPPTELNEDFNDGDDQNNYGGTYRGFAGGDTGGGQDGIMEAISVDAQGTTGAAGDYALHIYSTSSIVGTGWTYYGGVIALSETESVGQPLTSFTTLSFDMKLGSASAPTDWTVRLEDLGANGSNAGSYNYIDLEPYFNGENYVSMNIPLADFVSAADGGTIAPNLSQIDVIVIGGEGEYLVNDPDMFVDNVRLYDAVASDVKDWQLY
ncbi:hypothetical protein KQI84_14340 [bacterium]|nr:hypothetical protein [bacterium]